MPVMSEIVWINPKKASDLPPASLLTPVNKGLQQNETDKVPSQSEKVQLSLSDTANPVGKLPDQSKRKLSKRQQEWLEHELSKQEESREPELIEQLEEHLKKSDKKTALEKALPDWMKYSKFSDGATLAQTKQEFSMVELTDPLDFMDKEVIPDIPVEGIDEDALGFWRVGFAQRGHGADAVKYYSQKSIDNEKIKEIIDVVPKKSKKKKGPAIQPSREHALRREALIEQLAENIGAILSRPDDKERAKTYFQTSGKSDNQRVLMKSLTYKMQDVESFFEDRRELSHAILVEFGCCYDFTPMVKCGIPARNESKALTVTALDSENCVVTDGKELIGQIAKRMDAFDLLYDNKPHGRFMVYLADFITSCSRIDFEFESLASQQKADVNINATKALQVLEAYAELVTGAKINKALKQSMKEQKIRDNFDVLPIEVPPLPESDNDFNEILGML